MNSASLEILHGRTLLVGDPFDESRISWKKMSAISVKHPGSLLPCVKSTARTRKLRTRDISNVLVRKGRSKVGVKI